MDLLGSAVSAAKKLVVKPYPCLDVLSAVENNTGHRFIVEFIADKKIIFESGVSQFEIKESISSLFRIDLRIELSKNEFVKFLSDMQLHGHVIDSENISAYFYFKEIHAHLLNGYSLKVREFNGYIQNFQISSVEHDGVETIILQIAAAPLPAFMQQTNAYRAYVNKTVEEIIEDVFADFCKESLLTEKFKPDFCITYPVKSNRINCVQNGESHWDFVLRLIEEEDWEYVVTFNDKKCEIMIFDEILAPEMLIPTGIKKETTLDLIDDQSVMWETLAEQSFEKKNFLYGLRFINTGIPAPIQVLDSDARRHGVPLKSKEAVSKLPPKHKTPLQLKWTYGQEGAKKYSLTDSSIKFLDRRAEKLELKNTFPTFQASGMTNCLDIYLGSRVNANYDRDKFKKIYGELKKLKNYRVHNLRFVFNCQSQFGKNNCQYYTEMNMHPAEIVYGIKQDYERNYIDGTMHGIVKADDEKIQLDGENNYIKVMLPWQYKGLPVKSDYILARFMSPWASQNYGMFVTPRHGDEVVVSFEDGDPDLPVVLGCLYNQKCKYPVSAKENKHVLAIYDQPSENKKNNFLVMDHKKSSVDIAAAEHMRIRSFGDHLAQSRKTMTMKTSENMLSHSKEQMEFITEKNMFSSSKEEMEFITEKNMLATSKEQMELITEKNMFASSKMQMEFISEKSIHMDAKEQIEHKTDKTMKLDSKQDMSFKTEKNIMAQAVEKIVLEAQKKIEIHVGNSIIEIDSAGKINIKCTELSVESAGLKMELA
ncbi:contractile injection system protein, VgrG/Pvc8 family [Fluviispira vulneris]|uniref:contractile injection system protein, VgrG/Pvc8 family n=1 Tax=Fluviispira vulneris TaxID=2763012 RepID=UPI001644DCF9|nr:contractile injection system protein, VgrG/Pvc8 family [Fluviispira vulneris]